MHMVLVEILGAIRGVRDLMKFDRQGNVQRM